MQGWSWLQGSPSCRGTWKHFIIQGWHSKPSWQGLYALHDWLKFGMEAQRPVVDSRQRRPKAHWSSPDELQGWLTRLGWEDEGPVQLSVLVEQTQDCMKQGARHNTASQYTTLIIWGVDAKHTQLHQHHHTCLWFNNAFNLSLRMPHLGRL